MFRHLHNRELQCAADDMDSFLQAMLLRPLKPLTAYVNAHKSHLGPSTMLSRFDDLSVFVSWYCLQDIARYCLYTIPMWKAFYTYNSFICQARATKPDQGLYSWNAEELLQTK
jgi:hypothetical protein